MLKKYLNKTAEQLKKEVEDWELWNRVRVWKSKRRVTQDEIDEFYINMPDGYMANIEEVAQRDKDSRLKGLNVKGLKVLDFGCGTGVYGLELLKRGAEVDFYDLPSRAFEFVKWRVNEEGLKAGLYNDMNKLALDYDIIINIDVMEHLLYPAETFILLHNKLKDNGIMVLDTPLVRPVFEDMREEDIVDCEHLQQALDQWKIHKMNAFISTFYVPIDNTQFRKTDVRLFLLYNYSPGTTGDFLERALSKYAKVFTNRQFKCDHNGEGIKTAIKAARADCVLQIDSGMWYRMPKIDVLKACYSIDTFAAPEQIKQRILYPYDIKMYAQKKFAQAKNEHWVPLGVDTDVYKPIHCTLKYDVGFCGTFIIKRSQAERNKCLKALVNEHMKKNIELYIGRDYNEYAGLRYNESRFVFNMPINKDINMRFFEAAAAGVPQFYQDVDGLKDLGFEPDVHYIDFKDSVDLVKKMYLTMNDDTINQRETPLERARKIADAAYALVTSKHTYAHRARQIIQIIKGGVK